MILGVAAQAGQTRLVLATACGDRDQRAVLLPVAVGVGAQVDLLWCVIMEGLSALHLEAAQILQVAPDFPVDHHVTAALRHLRPFDRRALAG